MKKKFCLFLILVIAVFCTLPFSAFASVNDATGWDILDGVQNFFGSVIRAIVNGVNAIGDFFANLTRTIVNGINTILTGIGNFFANLIKAISNAVSALLSGIYRLFVPRNDYFTSIRDALRNALSKKFGGIVYAFDYLKNLFSNMSANRNYNDLMTIKFPKGHALQYQKFNLFQYAPYFSSFIRPIISGVITLLTIAFCYKRVSKLINT